MGELASQINKFVTVVKIKGTGGSKLNESPTGRLCGDMLPSYR